MIISISSDAEADMLRAIGFTSGSRQGSEIISVVA